MYPRGILGFSSGSVMRDLAGGVCPEAVASANDETRQATEIRIISRQNAKRCHDASQRKTLCAKSTAGHLMFREARHGTSVSHWRTLGVRARPRVVFSVSCLPTAV